MDLPVKARVSIDVTMILLLVGLLFGQASALAQSSSGSVGEICSEMTTATQAPDESSQQPSYAWQYGVFLDSGYLWANNHPANDLFRSRGTAYMLDQPIVNMAGAYLRKTPSVSSRWGLELTAQAGQDTR